MLTENLILFPALLQLKDLDSKKNKEVWLFINPCKTYYLASDIGDYNVYGKVCDEL